MNPQMTIDDLRKRIESAFAGWQFEDSPEVTDAEHGINAAKGAFRFWTSPSGEKIVVSLMNTTLTGSDRIMPQIRVFTDKPLQAYRYAKAQSLRYFLLVYCTSDATKLKFTPGIDPSDYIVSIESKLDDVTGGRVDIRSMYNNLSSLAGKDYFRVTSNMHKCTSLFQSSFIKICDSSGIFTADELSDYMMYFDSRPYMLDAAEGSHIVYNPSVLYTADVKSLDFPWNLLVHGAPGTGKSFMLNEKIKKLSSTDDLVYKRITFYEDYSYGQFVGEYMPIPEADSTETVNLCYAGNTVCGTLQSEHITYRFVPGPMAELLAKAFAAKMNGDTTKFVLVIEELNRANAASVFGDIFQALDREKGISFYEISPNTAFANYLFDEVSQMIKPTSDPIPEDMFNKIKIPDNIYIWATMNSADQGVFPLDSAFKRRWSYIYCDIYDVDPANALRPSICLPMLTETGEHEAFHADWNTFREEINSCILNAGFAEDRCLGYWFFSEEEIAAIQTYTEATIESRNKGTTKDIAILPNPLADKLFAYLFQDVFRNTPTSFFRSEFGSLSQIRRALKYLEVKGSKVDIRSITVINPQTAFIKNPPTV